MEEPTIAGAIQNPMHPLQVLRPVLQWFCQDTKVNDRMKSMIVTISGPSGSGKSNLQRRLMAKGMSKCVSHTTRGMRRGEVQGEDYHFVEPKHFDLMIRKNLLIEHSETSGARYGLSVGELDKAWQSGKTPVFVCDPRGLAAMRQWGEAHGFEVVSVFLTHEPSVLAHRIRTRDPGANWATIDKRIERMMEVERAWIDGDYEIVVERYDAKSTEQTVARVLASIASAHEGRDL